MPLSFSIDPDRLVRSIADGLLTDEGLAEHTVALMERLGRHPQRELMDVSSAEAVDLTGAGVRFQVDRD